MPVAVAVPVLWVGQAVAVMVLTTQRQAWRLVRVQLTEVVAVGVAATRLLLARLEALES